MLRRLKVVIAALLGLFVLAYVAAAITLALKDDAIAVYAASPASYATIGIFGASGTAGDGILKAALANPEISTIHVVTRRVTPQGDVRSHCARSRVPER